MTINNSGVESSGINFQFTVARCSRQVNLREESLVGGFDLAGGRLFRCSKPYIVGFRDSAARGLRFR